MLAHAMSRTQPTAACSSRNDRRASRKCRRASGVADICQPALVSAWSAARRALKPASSLSTSGSVAFGPTRANTSNCRSSRGDPAIAPASGVQKSASPSKSGGITPITVVAPPSRRIGVPTTAASAPNCSRQSASLSTMTPCASPSRTTRPRTGGTRIRSKKPGSTRRPCTRRTLSPARRIELWDAATLTPRSVRLAAARSRASGSDIIISVMPRASFLDSRNTIREGSG